MARKKEQAPGVTTNPEPGTESAEKGALSIQDALTEAAQGFAMEILRILGASTLQELTALAGKAATEDLQVRPLAGRPARFERLLRLRGIMPKKPSPRTSALRRMAGTKPVPCPYPDCQQPGIRSKMNFCNEHAEQLSKPERARLRQQQRQNHKVERTVLPEDKSAAGKR